MRPEKFGDPAGTHEQADQAEHGATERDPKSGRAETQKEKQDRNWNDLLQELRVMQTGTQIIAGFLLTLPFQERFTELREPEVVLYLALVVIAAVATCLMLMPVAIHRQLFGMRIEDRLVRSAHRVVRTVLWLIGVLITGVSALIFSMVLGGAAGIIVASVFAGVLFIILFVFPDRVARTKLS